MIINRHVHSLVFISHKPGISVDFQLQLMIIRTIPIQSIIIVHYNEIRIKHIKPSQVTSVGIK